MKVGGESGPAVEPGKPDASLLLQRIKAGEMPPGPAKSPLARSQCSSNGSLWSQDRAAGTQRNWQRVGDHGRRGAYWAFRPVTRPAVPKISPLPWEEGAEGRRDGSRGRTTHEASRYESEFHRYRIPHPNPLPRVRGPLQLRSQSMRFVLAKLQERGLSLGSDATRRRSSSARTSTSSACRRRVTR